MYIDYNNYYLQRQMLPLSNVQLVMSCTFLIWLVYCTVQDINLVCGSTPPQATNTNLKQTKLYENYFQQHHLKEL